MTSHSLAGNDFFAALDELLATSRVVIDRPRGTRHPRHPEVVYPLDYAYLDGTNSGDGEGIDVFRGTASGVGIVGAVFTVDVRKRDVEVKVLLDCSPGEIAAVTDFLRARLHLAPVAVLRA